MDGKILNLEDALKDVTSRLGAMEESIEMIKENEKHYDKAFVLLKDIQKMLKEKGFKTKENSQSLDQGPECGSPPEHIEQSAGLIQYVDMLKVVDVIELKTSITQLLERMGTVEKVMVSVKANDAEGDDNSSENHSNSQLEAVLTEQIDLVTEELQKMKNSQLSKQNQDLELKVEELANKSEEIMGEIDNLRKATNMPSEVPLIADAEYKRYEDDLVKLKDEMNALKETLSIIQSQAHLHNEHEKESKLETENKFHGEGQESFLEENQLEGDKLENIVVQLQKRIDELDNGNEKIHHEVKQVKNSEVTETTRTGQSPGAKEDFKSCCCWMNYLEENCVQSGYTEFTWELRGFSDVLSNFKNNVLQEVESDSFQTREPVYEMQARLMLYKDFLSIYLSFVQDENKESKSVYFHKRTFVVLDQASSGSERRDLVRSWEPSFGRKNAERWMKEFWGELHFVPLAVLEDGDRYVRNDKVFIKIVIEPLAMLYKTMAASDGMLFWKVEDYSAHKEREARGLIQGLKSAYFYSSQKGYRMQVELCLNGHGEENQKYVSAFMWFRRGPFDDFLPKAFPHRTTLWILDQSDSKEKMHLKKVVELDKIRNTIYSKLVLQSTIEDPRYLKNDALLIKVIVEPTGEREDVENENV